MVAQANAHYYRDNYYQYLENLKIEKRAGMQSCNEKVEGLRSTVREHINLGNTRDKVLVNQERALRMCISRSTMLNLCGTAHYRCNISFFMWYYITGLHA